MENKQIIVLIVTAVVAFLFGKQGLFQKVLDFVLGQKKDKELSVKEQISELKQEIIEKNHQIEQLQDINKNFENTFVDLKIKVVQLNTHVVTLLAYLETLMPEGVHPFIAEMAKEIRKNTNKENAK
jgi:cell division protein FtsB